MENSIYGINKGVNRPIEFKGLVAQYIWILAGGLIGLLILFIILYVMGVNMYMCLFIILISGGILFKKVYGMSNTYGQYGLMKKAANRRIPTLIRCNNRKVFFSKRN